MATDAFVDRVRIALEQQGTACLMEEIVALCPDLTWNQVFLAIDQLSRREEIRVTLDADRTYRIQTYRPAGDTRVDVSPVHPRIVQQGIT
ncbi:MAG: hypothetical protein H8K03_12525 [Nitrospira sp.]|jgi:hypothetical protein|nr:hypothetical protein [Nitrospira sp. BO4]